MSSASAVTLRRLGSTGFEVYPLCLGGSVFGWTVGREAGFAVLDAYADAGGNFVDTADVYSSWIPGNRGGESETLIGEWLGKRRGGREIVVATKVGSGAEGLERGLSREHVIAACEASLRRLGLEAIDLLYAHQDMDEYALEEALGAFDTLVRGGKVRAIGASNYTADRLREAVEISRRDGLASYGALQPRLNLVDRDDFTEELRGVCDEYDIGVAVYSPLASGFLTGKYRPGQSTPASPRAAGVASTYLSDVRALALLDAADRVAEKHDVTVAQVALAWGLAQPAVTSVIASATSSEQLTELLGATSFALDEEDVTALSAPE